ncbi:MAG: SH3 domain-containing protein [Anaerolineae bacterium]|nr:SH3 domain-containing protein [Anaerolineae bacterium]
MAVVIGDEESNLRAGPGTNYPTVGQVARGAELEIISRNAAGDWYEVCCVDGQQAWIVARLVEVTGDPNAVAIAANIPAPPTDTPVPTRPPAQPTTPPQPTAPPAPTNTPVPTFPFAKEDSRPGEINTNPIVTFFGALYNPAKDLTKAVGEPYKLVVTGPQNGEAPFHDGLFEVGPFGQFIYNVKVELPLAEGTYQAYVADGAGNRVSESWEYTVAGELRTFFPRWKQR